MALDEAAAQNPDPRNPQTRYRKLFINDNVVQVMSKLSSRVVTQNERNLLDCVEKLYDERKTGVHVPPLYRFLLAACLRMLVGDQLSPDPPTLEFLQGLIPAEQPLFCKFPRGVSFGSIAQASMVR